MSNYIISNGELYNTDELMHYGVPGMKWGKRKATYVSAHKGFKNARKARRDAYNDSVNISGAKKFGPVVAFPNVKSKLNARKAGKMAYKESIKNDKEHNKQLRAEKKGLNPNRKREIAIAATSVVGTALAAYGVYKVSKAIKDKHMKRVMSSGERALKTAWERGSDMDRYISDYMDIFREERSRSTASTVKYILDNNSVRGKVK